MLYCENFQIQLYNGTIMKLQSQSTSEFLINKSIKRQVSFDSIFDGKMFGSCDDV